MIRDYNKAVMATKTSPEGKALYEKVKDLEGREYNRAVSGPFLDDMLTLFDESQQLDFLPYMPTFLSALQEHPHRPARQICPNGLSERRFLMLQPSLRMSTIIL